MERDRESWVAWPVSWSGIWVGALAALTVGLASGEPMTVTYYRRRSVEAGQGGR